MTAKIIGISIYIGAAFGFALALVIALGLALHAGARVRRDPLPLIFLAIIAAVMVVPVATDRVLAAGLAYSAASVEDIGGSFWISRLFTLAVLALSAERILRLLFAREWPVIHGWSLCIAFLVFAMANQLLNGAFGAHRAFDHKALYALIVFPAVFIAAQRQPERCFRIARNAMLLFFVASALVGVVKPAMVIERGYAGLPGLPFRFYGLATHANTIGPLAIAFMICLWRFPFGNRWFNRAAWLLVAISLLVSQSKTSIAIAFAIGALLALYRYREVLAASVPGGSRNGALAAGATLCMILALGGAGLFAASDLVASALTRWDTATGGHLMSLTGRTRIWGLAWYEFTAHPLFGYGPTIWGPIYRFREGIPFASHAHNQYLQALSSAGIVGLLALLAYLVVLTRAAFRAGARSGGISIALLALLLLRTVTEVPFAVGSVMQSEFFIHLLVLAACVGFSPERKEAGDVLRPNASLPHAGRAPGLAVPPVWSKAGQT